MRNRAARRNSVFAAVKRQTALLKIEGRLFLTRLVPTFISAVTNWERLDPSATLFAVFTANALLRRAARFLVVVFSTPRFDFAVVIGNLARRGYFYMRLILICYCLRGVSRPAGRDQRALPFGNSPTFREKLDQKLSLRSAPCVFSYS